MKDNMLNVTSNKEVDEVRQNNRIQKHLKYETESKRKERNWKSILLDASRNKRTDKE